MLEELGKQTLDFLLRHAMQAVLTHLLFAEADPGESLLSASLLWDFDLLPFMPFGLVVSLGVEDSAALGTSDVIVWSSSSSRLGEVGISSEKLAGQRGRKALGPTPNRRPFHVSNRNALFWRVFCRDDGMLLDH